MNTLNEIDHIKHLKARYFRSLDTKDWSGLRDVFCEEAIFDLRESFVVGGTADGGAIDSGDPNVLVGVNAIIDLISNFLAVRTSVHHGHCHEIEVLSSDNARGVIAMEDIVLDEDRQTVLVHGWGHYHETYRRERGEWRILHSRLTRLHLVGSQVGSPLE